MKKKLIAVLVVIALLLALLIAGALGFLWYRNNHIFVEGTAYPKSSQTLDLREQDISFSHYESLRSQLSDCEILWNVPFQGGKYSSDSRTLSVKTLTEQDVGLLLEYFPGLQTLDAMECRDYTVLELLKAMAPEIQVNYAVTLGGKSFDPDVKELVLENGDYDFVTMMANLIHLPDVESIQLKVPELTNEQVAELRAAYEEIAFSCTVEILGREYDNRVTDLDLRDLESSQVDEILQKLPMLPDVTYVELTQEDGTCLLAKEEVLKLKEALPGAAFHYSFEFYGETISTTDEEVHIHGKKIGDAGIDEVRTALSLMENHPRFVLEYCQISYDLLAQVREEFRDKAKLVWRVEFGGGSTFTDAQIIRSTYDLVDDNCHNLIYCEDARFIDIGHNEYLDAVPFVAGMPNLEVIIVSGAPIKDLTPFENCKKLKVLEIAFCHYIEDIAPLASCESLIRLNIGFTQVKDLSPLDNLNITNLCIDGAKVSAEERERFGTLRPDCWITYDDAQPYNDGWRYDEKGDYLPWYSQIRSLFRYDRDPHIPNNVGWYLPDDFVDVDADVETAAAEPAETEEIPAETVLEEEAPAEEAPAEEAPTEEAPTEVPPVETKPIIDLSPLL